MGNERQAGQALATLGRVLWIAGEGRRAVETLERAIALLEPSGRSPELVKAYVWSSTQHMLHGRTDEGVAAASRGLEIEEGLGLEGDRSQLLNNIGVCGAFLGDPESLDRLREAKELAERSGDAEAIGRIYTNLPSSLAAFHRYREALDYCERGRELMRRSGSPNFEAFIASNQAGCFAELGRYEDAEAIAREALTTQRSLNAVPGIVNSGAVMALVATRRGRYDDARSALDEILPLSRGLGGTEFLSLTLNLEVELERARGNLAAARLAADETVDLVTSTPEVGHLIQVLPTVSHLLPPDRVRELVDRVRPHVRDPSWEAVVAEAEGIAGADRSALVRAADLYASLELPYQEARCRIEAGQTDRAAEIIQRFGLNEGPLGARLREVLAGSSGTA